MDRTPKLAEDSTPIPHTEYGAGTTECEPGTGGSIFRSTQNSAYKSISINPYISNNYRHTTHAIHEISSLLNAFN
jgi:hypothetical protein